MNCWRSLGHQLGSGVYLTNMAALGQKLGETVVVWDDDGVFGVLVDVRVAKSTSDADHSFLGQLRVKPQVCLCTARGFLG